MVGERPRDYEKRFSNGQARLVRRQLHALGRNVAHRQDIVGIYESALEAAGAWRPHVHAHSSPAFVRYPVWTENREAALRAAHRQALLGTWFTSVLEECGDLARLGYIPGSCPRAELAAQHLVNLPTHYRVSEQAAMALVSVVRAGAPGADYGRWSAASASAGSPTDATPASESITAQ
jgi:dTDP-4-amino-4,6-dideoxygalactose transaminase